MSVDNLIPFSVIELNNNIKENERIFLNEKKKKKISTTLFVHILQYTSLALA